MCYYVSEIALGLFVAFLILGLFDVYTFSSFVDCFGMLSADARLFSVLIVTLAVVIVAYYAYFGMLG